MGGEGRDEHHEDDGASYLIEFSGLQQQLAAKALRWSEAMSAGVLPRVDLSAQHETL